ncbi:MAG: PAS domain-containing protein, partial [Thermoanaerobaculia bacterium]|nr:PAS domain-containing protein [Thermoanaerobaculia bacterium]
MTLRRRLVIALACLALVLATEAVLTFQLNRAVERDVVETLGNALVASDGAVERALALAWVQAQTQELVTESYRRAYLGSAPSQDDDLNVASAGLTRGFDRLEASLAIQGVGEPVNDADTLQRDLRREFEALRGLTDHLLALAPLRPEEAHAHLDERIEPQVNHRLGPLIENRRLETERVLRERARRIAHRTQSSARLVIVINLITILLALGVVLSLLRSTGKRVEQLVEAAAAVGQGRLDTRIAITSHDDLGFLASTINQMAEDLARTTVSRSDLHNILESMPDALLILNAQLEVTRANEAALELLGYEPTELHGRAFPQLVSAAALAGPAMADLPPGQRLVTEAHLSSRDERETVAMVSVSALRTPSGSPDRYVCVAHDITERMKAEVRLRTLLADKDTLLRELH